MTDDEKSDAFARWNHDTSRSTAGTWDAFMAGVAAAEDELAEKDAEIASLKAESERYDDYAIGIVALAFAFIEDFGKKDGE